MKTAFPDADGDNRATQPVAAEYEATPSYARLKPSISSLYAITRFVFPASWSCIISPRADRTICQDRPNLSFSQPHCPCSPPSESLSQKPSSSACVPQLTDSEMASVNLKYGPPFNAWKRWPSSSKMTVSAVPFGRGPASP